LGLLAVSFKSAPASTHGDSKFASRSDLAAAGLLNTSEQGVIIGRVGGQYLRDSSGKFIILAAPTRSGKGVGIVIPVLLDYADSVVVLDIKGENFGLTSGYRAKLGHSIYVFNPFATDGKTHRWNPMTYVSQEPHMRIGDLRAIAQMLYPDGNGGGNERFFTENGRNVFMALSLYLFEQYDFMRGNDWPCAYPSFGQLYRLAAGDGEDLKGHLAKLAQTPYLSEAAKTAFAGVLSQASETFSSIMGTFNAPLTAWADPFLDAATSGDDFLLTDVRKKRMTIYLCVSPNKLAQAALILNLFFSQLINENTKTLPKDDKKLKHQCLLLMDEFTSIGPVEIIAHAVSYMAGYNMRLLPIIQSMAQLDATYGREKARTLVTNHATQIIYTPREQQDANEYSEMLGYTTVKKVNKSTSRGRETTHSYSEVEERRALMLPQELKAMSPEKEILLIEGMKNPAQVDKIRYYQEKMFKERLLDPVSVPVLEIGKKK
jgi:type IV secretion system protein VirD4